MLGNFGVMLVTFWMWNRWKTRYKDTTRFGSDLEAKFHEFFIEKMRKLMLSLERECKFSKIDVFITSPIFISRNLEKELKNQAFWDEAGSKIRLKNVLKCSSFF